MEHADTFTRVTNDLRRRIADAEQWLNPVAPSIERCNYIVTNPNRFYTVGLTDRNTATVEILKDWPTQWTKEAADGLTTLRAVNGHGPITWEVLTAKQFHTERLAAMQKDLAEIIEAEQNK